MEALPIGISEGRVLLRDIPKDDVISFRDVDAPSDGLVEALWHEQNQRWPFADSPESLLETAGKCQ
jgi:predicted homoserine dehydrogenase-like protein